MKTALLITLGTRDIVLNKQALIKKMGISSKIQKLEELYFKEILLARPGGEYLIKEFDYFKEFINFPIARPAINFVLQEMAYIDLLIFIATDQDKSTDSKYLNGDTLFFAELISKLLKESAEYSNRIGHVDTYLVNNRLLNSLDVMFGEFQRSLTQYPFHQLENFDKIYLSNQGGIDAINTALMLGCLNRYVKRTEILNINENGICKPLLFTNQYLNKVEYNKAMAMLNQYDYAGLLKLEISETVKFYAAYAYHRLNFDFESARKVCKRFIDSLRNTQNADEYAAAYEMLQQLDTVENTALVEELWLNAKVKYKQEAYVDFLLRLFRVTEELVKEKALKLMQGFDSTMKWKEAIRIYCNHPLNAGLKNFDYYANKNYKIDIFRDTPTIPIWLAICEYYRPDKFFEKLIFSLLDLSNMRNQSIGAHAFKPVSKELIDRQLSLNNTSIEELFANLDKYLNIKGDFYHDYNQKIERALMRQN